MLINQGLCSELIASCTLFHIILCNLIFIGLLNSWFVVCLFVVLKSWTPIQNYVRTVWSPKISKNSWKKGWHIYVFLWISGPAKFKLFQLLLEDAAIVFSSSLKNLQNTGPFYTKNFTESRAQHRILIGSPMQPYLKSSIGAPGCSSPAALHPEPCCYHVFI